MSEHAATLDISALKLYIELEEKKKSLDAQLKDVRDQMDCLAPEISRMFVNSGIDRMACDGRLVYLANDVYIGPVDGDKDAVIAALTSDSDSRSFVSETYNTNSLRAWVKEIADQVQAECVAAREMFTEDKVVEALPEPLRPVLQVKFGKAVRTRKA
jgi:hypothetical protein